MVSRRGGSKVGVDVAVVWGGSGAAVWEAMTVCPVGWGGVFPAVNLPRLQAVSPRSSVAIIKFLKCILAEARLYVYLEGILGNPGEQNL
jgi:hypothetical protein